MVAPAGTGPCPQNTCTGRSGEPTRIGTSPPGPLRCGSTTCSTKPAVTAASTALPPRSSTDMPAALASQCVDATMPTSPSSSGRVVKGVVMAAACYRSEPVLPTPVDEAPVLVGEVAHHRHAVVP